MLTFSYIKLFSKSAKKASVSLYLSLSLLPIVENTCHFLSISTFINQYFPDSLTGLQLDYGSSQNDLELSGIDDGCAPTLKVDYDIPFFGTTARSIFVSGTTPCPALSLQYIRIYKTLYCQEDLISIT